MFWCIWHGAGAQFGYPIMKLGKCIRVLPVGVYGHPFDFEIVSSSIIHPNSTEFELYILLGYVHETQHTLMWQIIDDLKLYEWQIHSTPKFME